MKNMFLLLTWLVSLGLVACDSKQPVVKQSLGEQPNGGKEVRFLYVMQADKAILRQEGDQ